MADNSLNITREEINPCHIKLNIEVPQDKVMAAFAAVEAQFRSHARVPGFRPGKAPRPLLLRHYGDRINEEVVSSLVRDNLRTAVEQEKVEPETNPMIENENTLKADESSSFSFSVEFDTAPEFNLPDYTNIELTEDTKTINDNDVEDVIQKIVRNHMTYEKVERAAQAGDMLRASYHVVSAVEIEDAEKVNFLLHGDNSWLLLSQPEMLPGISEQMQGAQAGESRNVTILFPTDFHNQSLAGKSLDYKIDVQEVHSSVVPEFSDEFVGSIGGGTSADEFKSYIRGQLEMRDQQQLRKAQHEQIVTTLTGQLEFDLPPRILAKEVYDTMVQIYNERTSRNAKEQTESEEVLAGIQEEADTIARQALKRRYVLRRIADKEGIKVENSEITNAIQMLSQHYRRPVKDLLRRMEENGSLINMIEDIRQSKTIDHIIKMNSKENKDNATIDAGVGEASAD